MKTRLPLAIVPCVLLLVLPPTLAETGGEAPTDRDSSYQIESSVFGAAGFPGASPSFRGNGTLGQPTPIGIAAAGGSTLYAGFWARLLTMASSVDAATALIFQNSLYRNFPNPIAITTMIGYSVAEESEVDIAIYDVGGRRVRTLVHAELQPGEYSVVWNGITDSGDRLPSGVYFCRLDIGSFNSVKKMLVLR